MGGKSEDYYYNSSKSGKAHSKSGKGGSKSSKSMDYHPDCDFTCSGTGESSLLVCAGFFHDAGAYCDGTSDCGGAMCDCVAGEYFCMEGKNPCVYGWSENKPGAESDSLDGSSAAESSKGSHSKSSKSAGPVPPAEDGYCAVDFSTSEDYYYSSSKSGKSGKHTSSEDHGMEGWEDDWSSSWESSTGKSGKTKSGKGEDYYYSTGKSGKTKSGKGEDDYYYYSSKSGKPPSLPFTKQGVGLCIDSASEEYDFIDYDVVEGVETPEDCQKLALGLDLPGMVGIEFFTVEGGPWCWVLFSDGFVPEPCPEDAFNCKYNYVGAGPVESVLEDAPSITCYSYDHYGSDWSGDEWAGDTHKPTYSPTLSPTFSPT